MSDAREGPVTPSAAFPGRLAVLWGLTLTAAAAVSLYPERFLTGSGWEARSSVEAAAPPKTFETLARTAVVFVAAVWPMFLLRRGHWVPRVKKSKAAARRSSSGPSGSSASSGSASGGAIPLAGETDDSDEDEDDADEGASASPPPPGGEEPIRLEPEPAAATGTPGLSSKIIVREDALPTATIRGADGRPVAPLPKYEDVNIKRPPTEAGLADTTESEVAERASRPAPAPSAAPSARGGELKLGPAAPPPPAYRELAAEEDRGPGKADPVRTDSVGLGKAALQLAVLALLAAPFLGWAAVSGDVPAARLGEVCAVLAGFGLLHLGYAAATAGWSRFLPDRFLVAGLLLLTLGWPWLGRWTAEFLPGSALDSALRTEPALLFHPQHLVTRVALAGGLWPADGDFAAADKTLAVAALWPAAVGLVLTVLSPLTKR
jgi:hypothetical protein